ncbi:MAG: hypothetical protein NTY38_02285 [Acidobacteria bacterium]|nr:hypothetical protein [Acidobacteriota bacterium]
MYTRIAKVVHDPVTATALALETKEDGAQAIMVSCDLVMITEELQHRLRDRTKAKLPGFDIRNLFLNSTHTHTGPALQGHLYTIPTEGVMQPAEYFEFLLDRLTEIGVRAWQDRTPGGVSWALGQAVVGHNRRAVYSDGHAQMYGPANRPDFTHLEGYEDHGVEMIFFWDQARNLTGIAINIACPSQADEKATYVSADFWGDVRKELRERYSDKLFVYPMTGAAGDQSPHLLFRQQAEERMRQRLGISETQEIGRRIARAVDYVVDGARKDIWTEAPFLHKVEDLSLPVLKITEAEAELAKREYDQIMKGGPSNRRVWSAYRARDLIERYDRQEREPYYKMELHVIRIGNIAVATNPFELFLDYGIRMKVGSRAEQTFVVQLATKYLSYLPTARGLAGGGFSADSRLCLVGPEGGQILVDRTVQLINSMWADQTR